MFRTYADPYKLEDQLKKAIEELNNAIYEGYSEGAIYDLQCEVEELREKVNFAWQDDEASEFGWDY